MNLSKKELEEKVGSKLHYTQTESSVIVAKNKDHGAGEELFAIFNEDDEAYQLEGKKLLFYRSECHGKERLQNVYHRGANVFVTNKGALYVPIRAATKDSYPGKADVSVSEHVKIGETYAAAAVRGLKEELGLDVNTEKLAHLFKKKIVEEENQEWAEYYHYESPTRDVHLSPESAGGEWVPLTSLDDEEIRARDFRRDHKPALKEVLTSYQS